jgi:uncharacterized protein (DUF305 family)
MTKSFAVPVLALVVLVLFSACTGGVPPPASQGGAPTGSGGATTDHHAGHNGQDVTFARQLIPHLSRARDMAKLVPMRSTDPAVVDLSMRVMRAQNPDIQQLMSWLQMWGDEFVPTVDSEAVRKLEQVEDAQFARMWTRMTIESYQAAITLAEVEAENGAHPEVRRFARQVIDTRRAEIAELRKIG